MHKPALAKFQTTPTLPKLKQAAKFEMHTPALAKFQTIPTLPKLKQAAKFEMHIPALAKFQTTPTLPKLSNKQQNLKCIHQLWQSFRRFQTLPKLKHAVKFEMHTPALAKFQTTPTLPKLKQAVKFEIHTPALAKFHPIHPSKDKTLFLLFA